MGTAADTALTFRDATDADVDALVELIESAYRGVQPHGMDHRGGHPARAADRPRGCARGRRGAGQPLLTVEREGRTVACCQLEHRGEHAYFGMFAVSPALQGAGLGRTVLAEAERQAREGWGVTEMHMTVITAREDLIAWYERRGYRRTGRTTPFPYGDERFGIPQRDDLEFELLVKELA